MQAAEGQDAIVETYTGGANRRVVHPSYQVWSYAALINDYNEYVQAGHGICTTARTSNGM